MKKAVLIGLAASLSLAFGIASYAAEWKKDANGWWYEHDDGSYTKSAWETIDGKQYCFNPDGYMYSNAVTPDGSVVAPSGEKIIPGAVYKDIYARNENMGITFFADDYDYDDGKKAQLIDRGAYYELTEGYFSTVMRFYLDMSDKKVGDILRLNNSDYRLTKRYSEGSWGVEAVDPNDLDAVGWYALEQVDDHYELMMENDFSMTQTLYYGSVYLSKDCKINTYFIDTASRRGEYKEWLSISDYLKESPDSGSKRRFYPISYWYGKVQLDQNGLITSLDQLYTP